MGVKIMIMLPIFFKIKWYSSKFFKIFKILWYDD